MISRLYKKRPNRYLNYCSPFFWKKIYLYIRCPVLKAAEKFIYSRSSVIPITFNYYEIKIYSGKNWHTRFVNRWMVGYKFGEFTWNRRMAIYKAKQLRKKKKNK